MIGGFALVKFAPKLHLIMSLLISFTITLLVFAALAVALGELGN